MATLVSFLETSRDPNLVPGVLGDNPPHPYLTRPAPSPPPPAPAVGPWDRVGDGSVCAETPTQPDSSDVRRRYGQSVEYTMDTRVSFLETYRDPNLVLVVLGDHQPHSYVTGPDPGHDVPVSVIARDPRVAARIAGWEWQPGLQPAPDATRSRMDAFRDRLLETL